MQPPTTTTATTSSTPRQQDSAFRRAKGSQGLGDNHGDVGEGEAEDDKIRPLLLRKMTWDSVVHSFACDNWGGP